jgi:hypothetical protein
MVAFNFADTTEAKDFKLIVDEKIYIRRRRDEKRKLVRNHPVSQQNNIHANTLREPYDYKKTPDPGEPLLARPQNSIRFELQP